MSFPFFFYQYFLTERVIGNSSSSEHMTITASVVQVCVFEACVITGADFCHTSGGAEKQHFTGDLENVITVITRSVCLFLCLDTHVKTHTHTRTSCITPFSIRSHVTVFFMAEL